MFALSDSFRFAMPVAARLMVKAKFKAEKEEEREEERDQLVGDATRYQKMKTRQLESLVEELQQRLDDKILHCRTLEDQLCDNKEQFGSTEARLKNALDEVDRLYLLTLQQQGESESPPGRSPRSGKTVARERSPSALGLLSPTSPTRTKSRSQSNAGGHGDIDILTELLGPVADGADGVKEARTPRQGELRRKGLN